MNEKTGLIILGLVAVIGMIVMYQTPAPVIEVQEVPTILLPVPFEAVETVQGGFEPSIEEMPVQVDTYYPSKAELAPATTIFSANRIVIPERQFIQYLPLRAGRIRHFQGRFGPYEQDLRQYLEVHLCSAEINLGLQACEVVQTSFRDGWVEFAKGYTEEEFIGGLAREQFVAFYVISNPEYGTLAVSNLGKLEFQ